jgi:hypothetical protein
MRKHILIGYGNRFVHKKDLHKHHFHTKGHNAVVKHHSTEHRSIANHRAPTKIKPLKFKFN